jgi:predicted dehydrogenase
VGERCTWHDYPDTFLYEFEITGRQGTVLLHRSTSQPGYNLVVTKGMGANAKTVTNEFFQFQGLRNEFLAFAAACRGRGDRAADAKNTPEEALQDLELVEALLEAGKQGGAVVNLLR